MFMFLESLHTYSIVAFVIKKNGILTKNQNLMLGWGVPLAVVFVITIYFKSDPTKINLVNNKNIISLLSLNFIHWPFRKNRVGNSIIIFDNFLLDLLQ
jgi:hypothetical protein